MEGIIMGLFDFLSGGSMKKFEEWAESASQEELSAALEKNRQNWLETGDYGPTEETLVREMNKRLEEEAKKNPHRDPNYRWTDKNRWE